MRLEIYLSSIALALVMLSLLAWKWRIDMKISLFGGIPIGTASAFIVDRINSASGGINIFWLLVMEFSFIFTITFITIFLRFYRDPDRTPLETENVIISPADGQVIYVNNVDNGSSLVSTKGNNKYQLNEILSTDLLAEPAYLVGIDMNILNVHVNRSPIRGNIIFRKRIHGKFLSLRRQESEVLNERVSTIIGNGKFNIGVIQIASRLVRSIISYGNTGDIVDMGQRIGMIVFGSQVDVAIPRLKNLKIAVKPGDKVKAGVTIIARYEG
jgi:phosphatidylserine decarboxylase